MTRARRAAICLLALALVAATPRDPDQRRAFRRTHTCPSTGRTTGACPGFVVDHVVPLCADGPDRPANMQWQRRDASLEKDRWERAICADRRRR